MAERKKWCINVGGYGSFIVVGSEENARQRGKDKANWEHGSWQIREATEVDEKEHKWCLPYQDVDEVYKDA